MSPDAPATLEELDNKLSENHRGEISVTWDVLVRLSGARVHHVVLASTIPARIDDADPESGKRLLLYVCQEESAT